MAAKAVDYIPQKHDSTVIPDAEVTPAYAWYVVLALTALFMLSFVDRQILSLLVGPIKRDLGVSDTQIGLLQGLAFALFYTLVGLPLGRVADTSSRRNLILAGVFVWSFFTTVCSAARSYWTLFFARFGVGVGEASLSPSAYSLIADYFPPERLGVAISVFYMGIFLGSSLALLAGGMVVDALAHTPLVTVPILGTIASWRFTFVIVGLPGFVLALLALTIREPSRKDVSPNVESKALDLREAMSEIMLRWKSLAGISIGCIFQSTCTYALTAWAPTFFLRVHGWTPGQSGRMLGLLLATFGCSGMYVGGRVSDGWFKRGIWEAPLRIAIVSALGIAVLLAPSMALPNASWTLILLGPGVFFMALPMGVSAAALQRIFPNRVRGQVSALFVFILSLGGLTLGPLMPGFLNDYFFHNEKMIGFSLSLTIAAAAALMLCAFTVTRRAYRADYELLHPQ